VHAHALLEVAAVRTRGGVTCAYGQPLKQRLYAWRSSSGKLYCSEFCADDEEEANFQNMRHHCTSAGHHDAPLRISRPFVDGANVAA
jgi:hypothetical protein